MIIENPVRSFFGMANARKLFALFQTQRAPFTPDDFADWLNSGNREAFARLPGFISWQDALNTEADKGRALEKMETLDVDTLPVVDTKKNFAGVVDRSRLTARFLIDVAKNLEKK